MSRCCLPSTFDPIFGSARASLPASAICTHPHPRPRQVLSTREKCCLGRPIYVSERLLNAPWEVVACSRRPVGGPVRGCHATFFWGCTLANPSRGFLLTRGPTPAHRMAARVVALSPSTPPPAAAAAPWPRHAAAGAGRRGRAGQRRGAGRLERGAAGGGAEDGPLGGAAQRAAGQPAPRWVFWLRRGVDDVAAGPPPASRWAQLGLKPCLGKGLRRDPSRNRPKHGFKPKKTVFWAKVLGPKSDYPAFGAPPGSWPKHSS